jgi:hypothetical protein
VSKWPKIFHPSVENSCQFKALNLGREIPSPSWQQNLSVIQNSTEEIVSAMIAGEIPQQAILSFTRDFWQPMESKEYSPEKYFMIQKSDQQVNPLPNKDS